MQYRPSHTSNPPPDPPKPHRHPTASQLRERAPITGRGRSVNELYLDVLSETVALVLALFLALLLALLLAAPR